MIEGEIVKMKSSVDYDEEVQIPAIPPPEIKRPRLHKWHVIAVVLVLVIVAQGVLHLNSSLEYNLLRLKHNSLTHEYDALETQNVLFQSEYDQLRHRINQRSQHNNASNFITPYNSSVEQIVTEITGGWSDPSNWDEFWEDVKAMYNWVINQIEYRYDGLFPTLPTELSGNTEYHDEMWQFPNETLSLGKGDCEDMAILLCSMILRFTEGEHWTECITLANSNKGHMGVQIPVGENELTILDPAGHYFTSDDTGNLVSKNVSVEINNWLEHWKSELGRDAYVSGVFANYLDETFSSTSEYILWMSTRRED